MPRIATQLLIVILAFGIYGPGIASGQFFDDEQDSPADAGDEIPGTTDPPASPPPTTPPLTPPTTPPSDGSELRTPRFNVRGGSVAARRPGTWVSAGLGVAVARQSVIIKERGGATFEAGVETPDVKKVILLGFLQNVFDAMNDFLVLALANSTLGNGLPIGGSSKPEILANGRVWEINKQTYQVIVLFADDVEKASAETPSNYTINGFQATSAVLDTTEPTVTVEFTGASFPANSSLTVALDRIKNTLGVTGLAPSTRAILINEDDRTKPTATVTAETDTQVEVLFSEVMDKASCEAIANYQNLANEKLPTDAELGVDGRTVTLTFEDPIINRTLRVSINGLIRDINDNGMDQKDMTVVGSQPPP